jgi:hypothetical protein
MWAGAIAHNDLLGTADIMGNFLKEVFKGIAMKS